MKAVILTLFLSPDDSFSISNRLFVVLQDLDLSKAANFRDMSKPMGAQTPDRLRQFQKRYNEWDDPQGKLVFFACSQILYKCKDQYLYGVNV